MTLTSAIGEIRTSAAAESRGRSGGFTLVELMVVLAIMVLMTAALPLALNRMLPARRTALAAERLVNDIRWLQIQSTAAGASGRIIVWRSGYRLEIRDENRDVGLAESTTLRLRRPATDSELRELIVYPDGASSAGRFEISDSGRRAVVEVSMLTGRARRIT